MASKRHLRRKSCEGKVRHESQEDARVAIKRDFWNAHERVGAYKCKFCGGWHVGHTPHKIRRAILQSQAAKGPE